MLDKWQRYNSFTDLSPEKQQEILKTSTEMKEDPQNPANLKIFLPVFDEWVSVPKTAVWAKKWGLKNT